VQGAGLAARLEPAVEGGVRAQRHRLRVHLIRQVVGSQLSARVSDRFGRKLTIAPGLALVTAALCGLPLASDGLDLVGVMACWAAGGCLVSVGPTALVSDLSTEADRPQALGMLRSFGDMGLLLGAGERSWRALACEAVAIP